MAPGRRVGLLSAALQRAGVALAAAAIEELGESAEASLKAGEAGLLG